MKSNKLQSVNHFHTSPAEGVTEAGLGDCGCRGGSRLHRRPHPCLKADGCGRRGLQGINRHSDRQDSRTFPPGEIPCSLQDPILKPRAASSPHLRGSTLWRASLHFSAGRFADCPDRIITGAGTPPTLPPTTGQLEKPVHGHGVGVTNTLCSSMNSISNNRT